MYRKMMMDSEPSWWRTRTVLKSSNLNVRYFLLFEFFQRNAQRYAILRASLSDGRRAWEGTFSHDEIFPRKRLQLGSDEKSAKLRETIDEDDGGLEVRQMSADAEEVVVLVHMDQGASDIIRLELPVKIESKAFVDRIMTYLAHVEFRLKSAESSKRKDCLRIEEAQSQVEAVANQREVENRRVEKGLKHLMEEKRKHWA